MICYTANVARVITMKQEDAVAAKRALGNALQRLQADLDKDGLENFKLAELLAERTVLNELLIACG